LQLSRRLTGILVIVTWFVRRKKAILLPQRSMKISKSEGDVV